MSIIDNLAMRLGYTRKTQEVEKPGAPLLAIAADNKFAIPDGSLAKAQAELYQRLSWVQMAISMSAQAAAGVELNVLRMEGEEKVDVPNHDFEKLLRKPNPLMSRFEFLEATFAYRQLTGNAFWWLNRQSENEEPQEIWVLPPQLIKPIPDEKMYLKGYEFRTGKDVIELPLHQIVHFRRFHPINSFVGLSPIEALAVDAVGDLEMQKWNTRLFGKNNGRIPSVLAFADPINDTDWALIQEDIRNAAREQIMLLLRNAGKGGVEWMQAAMSQKDMEYLEGRNFTKEEIFGIYAPGLASMLAINATEANAKSGKATFTEFCIWPMLTATSEKITNDIMPVYGEDMVAEFEDIRALDRVLELQEQQEYSKVHTVDEIRKEYYQDDPLKDKRGLMLPAQIGPGTKMPGEEPVTPPPPPAGAITPPPQQEPGDGLDGIGAATPAQPEETPMQAEMTKWQRKALRALRAGKSASVSFESDFIDAATYLFIQETLKSSLTSEAVRKTFELAGDGSMTKYDKPTDGLFTLALELRRANDLLEATIEH